MSPRSNPGSGFSHLRKALERAAAHVQESWKKKLSPLPEIAINNRLRTSLASCSTKPNRIGVNPHLLNASDPTLLHNVLIHELAHIVVADTVGRDAKPHGPEWRRLMELAGVAPKPSMKLSQTCLTEIKATRLTARYRHTCPVCQFTRTSKRPEKRWRCASCAAAGLEGRLNIESYIPKKQVR